MNTYRLLPVGWGLVFVLAAGIACDGSPSRPDPLASARLRVIHSSSDAPPVDVIVDGQRAIAGLAYGKASKFLTVETGPRAVRVDVAGDATTVLEDTLALEGGKDYTVFAVGSATDLELAVTEANSAEKATKGQLLVRFFHAAPTAPAVDIRLDDETPVLERASFKQGYGPIALDAGSYAFAVATAGASEPLARYRAATLNAGDRLTIVALAAEAPGATLTVRVFLDSSGDGDTFTDLEPAPAAEAGCRLRVVHLAPDAPAVDVAVDGELAFSKAGYGASTGYAKLDAGLRQVTVTPSGGVAALLHEKLTLVEGTSYSAFALADGASVSLLSVADRPAASQDKAQLRLLHAVADAPAVDIRLERPDGPSLFDGVKFKQLTDYVSVDPGNYRLVLAAAGAPDALINVESVTLAAGKVYTAIARGTLSGSDATPFVTSLLSDDEQGDQISDLTPSKARVMLVHASPDAPAVDAFFDGSPVSSDPLSFPQASGYLEIAAGKRRLAINAAGTNTAVIKASPVLEAGASYSIFAINKVDKIEPLVLVDKISTPAAGWAHLRFVHLVPDAPKVSVKFRGHDVFTHLSFKDATAFTPVPGGTGKLEVVLAADGQTVVTLPHVDLSSGASYTIFARGIAAAGKLGATVVVNQK